MIAYYIFILFLFVISVAKYAGGYSVAFLCSVKKDNIQFFQTERTTGYTTYTTEGKGMV